MSTINDLDINGRFFGITSSKGDIIVNDGISNVALSTDTDGYILSSDSSTLTGLRWIPNISGTSSSSVEFIPNNFSTNSIVAIHITGTSKTNLVGNVLFLGNINCMLSVARQYFTIGIYKNGNLVEGTARRYGGIDNVIIPVSFQQNINVVSTDIIDLRIFVSNPSVYVFIEGADPLNTGCVLINDVVWSTNNTDAIDIPSTTVSGVSGEFIIMINLVCALTYSKSYFYIGIYKNNLLIETEKKYGGTNDAIIPIVINKFFSLSNTDIVNFKVRVSSGSTTINIYKTSMAFITYNNNLMLSPQLSFSNIFSTNSTVPIPTDLVVAGLTGSYILYGNITASLSVARTYFYVAVFKNGNMISKSEARYGGIDAVVCNVSYLVSDTLIASDTIVVRIWVDTSLTTLTITDRTLNYVECILI